MNLLRKLTLVAITGAVALGAGHFVQKKAADRVMAEADVPTVVVSSVIPVAAGPADAEQEPSEVQPPVLPAEAAPIVAAPQPQPPAIVPAVPAKPMPPVQTVQIPQAEAVPNCDMMFDLVPQSGAMIGISLLAPCNPDERVVLRHAGLVVTAKTSASGSLLTALPALTENAAVEVSFPAGETVQASVPMTNLSGVQRFAVQWQADDAFQLHAFENGAGYDEPGHISAAFTGKSGETGMISLLGDTTTDLPLLAEVYTFGPDSKAEVVIEAAVTESTCGRELLGETILAKDGSVEITDLTLAMPACDGIGDILVLKNLVQDMTLAAAN